jgi:hypothetical protein
MLLNFVFNKQLYLFTLTKYYNILQLMVYLFFYYMLTILYQIIFVFFEELFDHI